MARDIDMKMNGSKQHVVLGLLLLVLIVGYTSGSVLPSQQEQESVTQDNVATEQVQQECDEGGPCDEEGATSTNDCNNCYCLNGQWSCSNKICAKIYESEGSLETINSTKAPEDPDIQEDPDNEDPDYPEDSDNDDPDYQEVPDFKKCVEGTRWTKECNICECSFGQAICTMKACQCVKGTYWVDECNTCECYEGEAICSNNNCLSDSATRCAEGSSWRQDCNTCFCSNGIVSCTKKICPDEVTTIQPPTTTECGNVTGQEFVGCSVMRGVDFDQNIIIPPELNFCIYTMNGQKEYFAYIPKCYDKGKLACGYCEDEVYSKYNPGTCKCHKPFRG